MTSIKRKKLSKSFRGLCSYCTKTAVVVLSVGTRREHKRHACDDHESKAKADLKGGSW